LVHSRWVGWTSPQESPQSPAHLSPIDIVQHEVKLLGGLEGVAQAHEERVLHVLQQHIALCHDVVLLRIHTDRGACHSPLIPAQSA
jgi:hypothetical protein